MNRKDFLFYAKHFFYEWLFCVRTTCSSTTNLVCSERLRTRPKSIDVTRRRSTEARPKCESPRETIGWVVRLRWNPKFFWVSICVLRLKFHWLWDWISTFFGKPTMIRRRCSRANNMCIYSHEKEEWIIIFSFCRKMVVSSGSSLNFFSPNAFAIIRYPSRKKIVTRQNNYCDNLKWSCQGYSPTKTCLLSSFGWMKVNFAYNTLRF